LEFEVFPLFSQPVASFQLEEPLQDLLDFVNTEDSWVQNTGEKVNKNYRSGTTTILEKFPAVEKVLLDCVHDYTLGVMGQPSLRLKITTSWLTKTSTLGYSKVHSHFNSFISGVVHLEGTASDNDGPFIVEAPTVNSSFILEDPVELTMMNSATWRFPPVKNRLLLFPSYLRHAIGTHYSRHDRHSLAFNTYPVGSIGLWDSAVDIIDVRGA